MTVPPKWLPKLILLEESNGNWEQYLEVLYDHFRQDFVYSTPLFQGKKLAL